MPLEDKIKKKSPIHDTVTGYDFQVDNKLTPMRAIRNKCLECSGTSKEVRECKITDCTLWPYRSGKAGRGSSRVYTDAEKKAVVERFRKARLKRENKVDSKEKKKVLLRRRKKK